MFTTKKPDRLEIMSNLCINKKVLDVGCIGEISHHLKEKNRWLFWRAKCVAKSIIGIDLDKKSVDIANRDGYEIFCFNAEDYCPGESYEIVLLGEVLEHVNNPGLLLKGIHRLLKKDGQLVLSTPNIYAFEYIYKPFLGLNPNVYRDHSLGFNEDMLKLILHRHDFEITKMYYTFERVYGETINDKLIQIKQLLMQLLCLLNPKLSSTIVVVARPRLSH